MNEKFRHKYYNDSDEIFFEKLDNFKKFNLNKKNNKELETKHFKYSNSDKNYFNNIIRTEEKGPQLNVSDLKKETSYYQSTDFKKFDQLNKFQDYKNSNLDRKTNQKLTPNLNYSPKDINEFNKIIKSENNQENNKKKLNKNIKIIDYNKSKENQKIKNKVGIEKIKIVYFD